MTGLYTGITLFIRVTYQHGNGLVQRVLDMGAMGIIFPYVQSAAEAKVAAAISKYPRIGCRSMTRQLPAFSLKPTPAATVIQESNISASSVFLTIENKESIDPIDEIAAVEGVDALLIGSNDLPIELGVPGAFTL